MHLDRGEHAVVDHRDNDQFLVLHGRGPLPVGLELEGLAYGFLRTTADFREGVEAITGKRKPHYTGE